MTVAARHRRSVGVRWLAPLVAACAAACDGGSASSLSGTDARLTADGTDIVDGTGQRVLLRGVNLGAWLFHETWITAVDHTTHGRVWQLGHEAGLGPDVDAAMRETGPGDDAAWLARFESALAERAGSERAAALIAEAARYPSIYDDSDLPLRALLETRFGADGRDELLGVFQDAWIREADIAFLAAQGFNVVRVPITYRTLVRNSDLVPPTSLEWNEASFQRIERLLDWCERYRVYAVLDIQEAPGGQNDYSGPAELYASPAYQALTVELWEELSRRFGKRDIVAAYSLLAEPFGAPSTAARDRVYDQLVEAIRARGDDHLLVIHDGFFGMGTLPTPAELGWDGVVYSTHLFEFGVSSLIEHQLLIALENVIFPAAQARQGVPYYIGSFSTMEDEEWAYQALDRYVRNFAAQGWSWSLWTYKRIDDPIDREVFGTSTSWGLLGRLDGTFERADVYRDSRDTLARKFRAYAELGVEPNPRVLDTLVAATPAAQ